MIASFCDFASDKSRSLQLFTTSLAINRDDFAKIRLLLAVNRDDSKKKRYYFATFASDKSR